MQTNTRMNVYIEPPLHKQDEALALRRNVSKSAVIEAAVRMAPALHELLALHEPEGAPVDARLCRGPGPRAALTARAVAVTGGADGLRQLEADPAAEAAAGD